MRKRMRNAASAWHASASPRRNLCAERLGQRRPQDNVAERPSAHQCRLVVRRACRSCGSGVDGTAWRSYQGWHRTASGQRGVHALSLCACSLLGVRRRLDAGGAGRACLHDREQGRRPASTASRSSTSRSRRRISASDGSGATANGKQHVRDAARQRQDAVRRAAGPSSSFGSGSARQLGRRAAQRILAPASSTGLLGAAAPSLAS